MITGYLGITPDKVKIVSIVEGSVIITYEIALDDETRSSEVI